METELLQTREQVRLRSSWLLTRLYTEFTVCRKRMDEEFCTRENSIP